MTIQLDSSEGTTSNQINVATKLQSQKYVNGGRSRCSVYGTIDLPANIRHGASSLIEPYILASTIDHSEQLAKNECLHKQVLEATEIANATNERSHVATKRANLAIQNILQLEGTIKLMQQQLAMTTW